MDETNWSYIDFESLINSVLNGDKSIQEPFVIYNETGDKINKLSFINHLLAYENIHKDNFLETIYVIHKGFQDKLNKLQTNDCIKNMIQKISGEWSDDDTLFYHKDVFPSDFFQTNKDIYKRYNDSCQAYDIMRERSMDERNIPLDAQLSSTHPMERHIDGCLIVCSKTIQTLEKNIKEITELIQTMDNFNINLMIDLSIKHKPLYIKLNNGEDSDIPENIHLIYSNFIYIHLLLKKQLIHELNKINSMLYELKEKCQESDILKNNLTTVAFVREPTEVSDSNILYDVINGITGMFSNSSLDDLQNQINAEEEELRQQELQKDKLENLEQELKHSIHDELVLDTDNKPNTVRDKILSFY